LKRLKTRSKRGQLVEIFEYSPGPSLGIRQCELSLIDSLSGVAADELHEFFFFQKVGLLGLAEPARRSKGLRVADRFFVGSNKNFCEALSSTRCRCALINVDRLLP
jgi:hypothetical protein